MIEDLLAIASSSAVGGLLGGVFGWLSKREDAKVRKADQAHEIAMLGATVNAAVTTNESRAKAEVAISEATAFEKSQEVLSSVGATIKSVYRPLITTALLYMTYCILVELQVVVGGLSSLPMEEAVKLYRDITLSIISLTAMAVSWWFGSRPSAIRVK